MKKLSYIVLLLLAVTISYALGYLSAANNTSFLLSTTSAKASLATLDYLKNKQYEMIKDLHTSEVEISIAAIEDIMNTEGKLSKIPSRFKLYSSMKITDKNKAKLASNIRDKHLELLDKNNK